MNAVDKLNESIGNYVVVLYDSDTDDIFTTSFFKAAILSRYFENIHYIGEL